ncbi:HTH-type transcriptional repressor RspR [compost metagenome]
METDLFIKRDMTTLRQQVTARLRDAIVAGALAPGQRLVERELCENLGVSRPLVREALQQLEAEGLVNLVPHKGPVVATISAEESQQIYAVRAYLEACVGEGFARNASEAQIERLRGALRFLATPEASMNTDALVNGKNEFYAILMEGSGNKIASQMLTQLNNRITLLRRVSLGRSGRLAESLKELDAVVVAIEKRDAEATRKLCFEHVISAARAAGEARALAEA